MRTCSPRPGRGTPDVLLLATGSEVQIALAARELLEADGVATRVVSVPCVEWFREQDEAYRRSVLPPDVRGPGRRSRPPSRRAGTSGSATHGECVSLEHFGASAPYHVLYEQFGLTAERVVAAARASLSTLGKTSGSTTGN